MNVMVYCHVMLPLKVNEILKAMLLAASLVNFYAASLVVVVVFDLCEA